MQVLKQNETLATIEKQERMRLLQKQYRDSSKAVLTAEQLTKLKSIREDSTHMNRKHMEKKELQDSLNLTDEQVVKLKEMHAKDQLKS
jgi:Spy/CpxP family protein refolding chaperone